MGILKSIKAKGQVFYTDFTVATLIIVTAILIYYGYVGNSSLESGSSLNEMIADVNTISSSLVTSGSPENWTASNVQRIGITNGAQRILDDRVEEFQDVDYNNSREHFSTRFDYAVFFESRNGTVMPFDGECAIGHPGIVVDFNGSCIKPDLSIFSPKKTVRDTRMLVHNSEIVRMNIYLWSK